MWSGRRDDDVDDVDEEDGQPGVRIRQPRRSADEADLMVFRDLCAAHQADLVQVTICYRRRAGVLLSPGVLTNERCFVDVPSRASRSNGRKETEAELGSMHVVPHGFRMAVNHRGTVYVGEVQYQPVIGPLSASSSSSSSTWAPRYRYYRMDGANCVDASGLFDLPTKAFKDVWDREPGDPQEKKNLRPKLDGALMLGVTYCSVQCRLRQLLAPPSDPNLLPLYERWLRDEAHKQEEEEEKEDGTTTTTTTAWQNRAHKRTSSGRLVVHNSNDAAESSSSAAAMAFIQNRVRTVAERALSEKHLDDQAEGGLLVKPPLFVSPLPQDPNDQGNWTTNVVDSAIKRVHHTQFGDEALEAMLDSPDSLGGKSIAELEDREMFSALLDPGTKFLTRDQLQVTLSRLLDVPISDHVMDQTFRDMDRDADGMVTLDEFTQTLAQRESKLRKQFNAIDSNRDGKITLEELRDYYDAQARLNGEDTDLDAERELLLHVVERVDNMSLGGFNPRNEEFAIDRCIRWQEFRAMMILLPPCASIAYVISAVRDDLQSLQSSFNWGSLSESEREIDFRHVFE